MSLWNWLAALPSIPWVMARDFNMIENQDDKAGGIPFEWKCQEKPHWDRFKQHMQLFDPLEVSKSESSALWYTWCNFQQGPNRIYSRLGRFYVNKDFFSFSPNHLGNSVVVLLVTLSDHFPIIVVINTRNSIPNSNPFNKKFILNTSLLNDKDALIAIKMVRIFNMHSQHPQSHTLRWNRNVSSWQKIFQTIGQKKAKDLRFVEKTLTNRLHSLEHEIQLHPSSSVLVERVCQARDILRKHQQVKIRGAFIRAVIIGSNSEIKALKSSSISLHKNKIEKKLTES